MTHSTQQLSPEGVAEGKRGRLIRELVNRDKTPLIILIMAAVVGVVTGLLGVAFDRGVDWVQQQRLLALANVADYALLVWPLAFIMSALLAMMGYFWLVALLLRLGGLGSPKSKGQWRKCGQCAGGA